MADSFRDVLKDIDQSTDYSGMRKAFDVVAPSIAPTIGAVAMTPALGPWAGPVVGGVAGEMLNNVVGLTKPSVGNYAAQALVPPAMRGAANLKRLAPTFGTEKRGAATLNEIGKKELTKIQADYQPLTPSDQLFARIGNEVIPMPGARDASDTVLQRIASQLPSDRPLYAKSGETAHDVRDLFKEERVVTPETALYPEELGRYTVDVRQGPGGLPASRFQESIRTVGERLRAARRGEENVGGTANIRNYSTLFGGYAKDLDASPILKRARESFKREATLEDIGETAKIFTPKGHGEKQQINVNRLIDQLRDDTDEIGKFFHQTFSQQERQEILKRLGRVNDLPGLGPGAGQAVGSSKVNPVMAAMLGGGALGYGHGGAGEAMGAAAGAYALSGAGRMARDLSIAYNIPAGRALIGQLLDRSGGKLTPEVWAGIQAFAAAQTASLPTNARIIKEPRKPLLAHAE